MDEVKAGTGIEKVDEEVIIRTLKTNKLESKEINRIYEAIKTFDNAGTGIRMTLYELRGEYVEAFKL